MTLSLGIMQGRLSPPPAGRVQCFPRDTWAQEIAVAPRAGVDAIEWIYDRYGLGANPLEDDGGIDEVRRLSARAGVAVASICADWFMEEMLVGGSSGERLAARARLDWLLGRGQLLGVRRVVLPFVDASALTSPERLQQATEAVESALPRARSAGIELHLETSLGPQEFAGFLQAVPERDVRVNYDTGNSSSLGYDPAEEFDAYGDRLGSVHLKDRVRQGGTVPLGTGDADFDRVFAALHGLGYDGPFVLQAARGTAGDELAHVLASVAFARPFLESLASGPGPTGAPPSTPGDRQGAQP